MVVYLQRGLQISSFPARKVEHRHKTGEIQLQNQAYHPTCQGPFQKKLASLLDISQRCRAGKAAKVQGGREDIVYFPQCTASNRISFTGGHVGLCEETHFNYQKSLQSFILDMFCH